MKKNKKIINLKDLSIFDTDFRNYAQTSTILGLGKNYFSPSTNTTDIKVLGESYSEKIAFGGYSSAFPLLSSYFQHESAHSLLTSLSTSGLTLQRIIVLRNSLCFLILKKMKTMHGKIWVPLSNYLNYDDSRPEIKSLLKKLNKILYLERLNFDGWIIGQELFAFLYTIFSTNVVINSFSHMFNISEKSELAYSLHYMILLTDYDKSIFVLRKLHEYCKNNDIDWESLKKKDLFYLLKKENEIFGEDNDLKSLFKGFVNLASKIGVNDTKKEEYDAEKIRESIYNEITNKYKRSGHEHLSALNVITELQKLYESDFKVLLSVALPSLLYLPKINPIQFLSDDDFKPDFKSIDDAILHFLKSDLSNFLTDINEVMDNIFDNEEVSKNFFEGIIKFQSEMGWVPISDKKTKESDICGSEEWINSFIEILSSKKNERKLLSVLNAAQNTPKYIDYEIRAKELHGKILFMSNRILIRAGMLFGKLFSMLIRKQNPQFEIMFSAVKNLNLNSASKVARFMKRYMLRPVSIFLDKDKDHINFIYSDSTFYKDENGFKLLLPVKEEEYMNNYWKNYFLTEFIDICINNTQIRPFICPYGRCREMMNERYKGKKASDEKYNKNFDLNLFQQCSRDSLCGIKKLFQMLKVPDSIVLCGYGKDMRYLRFSQDGDIIEGSEVPFDIFFFNSEDELKTTKDSHEDDKIRESFQKAVWEKEKPQNKKDDEKTENLAFDRAGAEHGKKNKNFMAEFFETTNSSIKKMKKEMTEKGKSEIYIKLVAGIYYVLAIIILMPFGLFNAIIKLPFLVLDILTVLYKISIYPGKKLMQRRMRNIRSDYFESRTKTDKEINTFFKNLSIHGLSDG